jgi:hypothetical protein
MARNIRINVSTLTDTSRYLQGLMREEGPIDDLADQAGRVGGGNGGGGAFGSRTIPEVATLSDRITSIHDHFLANQKGAVACLQHAADALTTVARTYTSAERLNSVTAAQIDRLLASGGNQQHGGQPHMGRRRQ